MRLISGEPHNIIESHLSSLVWFRHILRSLPLLSSLHRFSDALPALVYRTVCRPDSGRRLSATDAHHMRFVSFCYSYSTIVVVRMN